MSRAQNQLFTAREIAAALGVNRVSVLGRLSKTPATDLQPVCGNTAQVWALESLPADLRSDLEEAWRKAEAVAAARLWRDLPHFISDPPLIEIPRARRARELPVDGSLFAGMQATLDMFSDAAHPTPAEMAWLWDDTFAALESAVTAGRKEKKVKRALLRWMHARPFLFSHLDNLRRDFNRKLAKWQANGRKAWQLVDQRAKANAERRVKLSAEDRDQLVAAGLFKHGGEAAPAWRECQEAGTLSNRLCRGYVSNPARRDYVPRSVMREIRPELKSLLPWQRGSRQARLNGAFIETIHDEAAGDWYSSDDFTLEVYFYIPNADGWFDLTRGQWLPLVDCRSKKILDFILIPEKRYTGAHIRTLLNHGCTEIGLPRRGFHFENGTWRKSKLVGGALPWGELKMNFADRLGLKISFASRGMPGPRLWRTSAGCFKGHCAICPDGWGATSK